MSAEKCSDSSVDIDKYRRFATSAAPPAIWAIQSPETGIKLVCDGMSVQFPNPESNPCPHGSSNGGLGGCVIDGGGVGEPPNRQCTALLNQGIDLLNHDIASKTLSGVKLELARRGGQ